MKKKYFGDWRIVEMEQWDKDYIDLIVPGYFTVEKDGTGSFHFGTVEAEIDSRVESLGSLERLEFTFEGEAESDPVSGRGWAIVDADTMTGHLYFHMADESAFTAKRQ